MKNLIFISTLLAAGTLAAFATEPTGTYYTDGSKEPQSFTFNNSSTSSYRLVLETSGTYKNVSITSGANSWTYVTIKSGVTFDGFTFNGLGRGEFIAEVGSVLGGNIEFLNLDNTDIYSKLSSGTHFSIDSNSSAYFHSCIWNIASVDLTKPLVEGEGWVGMSSNDTFALNFLSAKDLKEQTISLVSEKTKVFYRGDYSGFKSIAITLNGKVVSNYTATLNNDHKTISISRAVPEPSMFGLVAGTLALALAGTRRRRRK